MHSEPLTKLSQLQEWRITTAPAADATDARLRLGNALVGGSAAGTWIGVNQTGAADFFNFQTSNVSKARLTSAGHLTLAGDAYVGSVTINDGSPVQWLGGSAWSIYSSGGSGWLLRDGTNSITRLQATASNTGGVTLNGQNSAVSLTAASIPWTVYGAASQSGNLTDWRSSANALLAAVSKDGYFGSGITPSAPFHAYGVVPEYWNQSSGGVTCKWTVTGTAAIFGTSSAHSLYFRSNGTDRGVLTSDGKWAFGTTSNSAAFNIISTDDVAIGQSGSFGNVLYASAGNTFIKGPSIAFQVPNGTNAGYVASGGIWSFGGIVDYGAQVNVGVQSASTIGAVIRGAAAQSANLFEVQNSAGTALTYIKPSGHAFITCTYVNTLDSGLRLNGNITGVAWSATAGGSRNFAALNNYSGGGVLDFLYSSSTGGNPDTYLLRLDGPNNSVGLGGDVHASALLYMSSVSQGFRPPAMTTVQKNAISSPVEGLIVYDTTLHKLCVRVAAAWETITSA